MSGMESASNLAKIVTRRTYSREDLGHKETWEETVDRYIRGSIAGHSVSEEEINKLRYFGLKRKAMPAGRGIWYSGSPSHSRIGGVALNNCWFLTLDDWCNYVIAQDLLMLGGGVGASVEHRFVCKLPKIKKDVVIIHKNTKDADFIIPDTREGWCKLTELILEAFFETGKSFSYSTFCVRGRGEDIKGFGGKASGPLPLINFVEKLCGILISRQGLHIRPIDAGDLLCCIGEMVVAGNVRRSAIILIGDPWDKEYLKAKRWDLGVLPSERAMANFSVACDDFEDLHALFWKSYEHGEPFGIVNRKNIQKYGRMGELKKDSAIGVNPCKPLNALILTKNGYITYKQALSLSSLVVKTPSGWKNATKPFKTGEKRKICRIKLNNGSFIYGTKNHIHMLSNGEECELGDLKIGDKLKYNNDPIYTIDNIKPNHNYDLGLICGWIHGDGWFSTRSDRDTGHNVGLCFGQNESDVVKIFEKLLDMKTIPHEQKPKTCCQFRSHNKKYANLLLKEGMSLDKNDLTWIYGKTSEFKFAFIKALFTADGSVRKNNNVELYSKRYNALEVVSNLLNEFGIYNTITIHNNAKKYIAKDGKARNNSTCYKINVYGGQFKKIGFLSKYKNDLLKKHELKTISRRKNWVSVVSIEKEYSTEDVYDITVNDNKHWYIDTGVVTHNCAEATLENGEPCNLQEIPMPNLSDEKEFVEAAVLMHRHGKRVTCERYHHEISDKVIKRNRRIGTGITGCLQSSLFKPEILDRVYNEIQKENVKYSQELGIPESIRTTVVKPSGTLSKLADCTPGIHPAYSQYFIQRIRFDSKDPLVAMCKENGHLVEPAFKLDGTFDHNTSVIEFYVETPEGTPVADKDWDTFKQLEVLKMAQKHWADQAVSVTVYYKKEELSAIKVWLSENLKYIKTISFLCHNDHGFVQAPMEAISKERYEKAIKKIKPLVLEDIKGSDLESMECSSGACPVK